VYLGISSSEAFAAADPSYPCCTFRGSVIALDVQTGAIVWRTYTVPEGYSGGAVWGGTPVVDGKRHAVYITTGQNYSAPDDVFACLDALGGDVEAAAGCVAPHDYADAVLALDMSTGAIKWARRLQSFDVWSLACGNEDFGLPRLDTCKSPTSPDYDVGAASLFTVRWGAEQGEGAHPSGDTDRRDLLGAGQKSGVYWALDPDNGSVVWATQVGPGSARGGILWGSATDGQRVYVAAANWESVAVTLIPSGQTTTSGWVYW
jgi:polyvinyl alcohol dehydrogenase (cytochrome)